MSSETTQPPPDAARQMWLGIPARFVPERATPKTSGELIAEDAADRERQRRKLERRKEELAGGAD